MAPDGGVCTLLGAASRTTNINLLEIKLQKPETARHRLLCGGSAHSAAQSVLSTPVERKDEGVHQHGGRQPPQPATNVGKKHVGK